MKVSFTMSNRSRSRRKTPWDDIFEPTDTQEFLQMHYVRRYEERHCRLVDTGEAKMINSYVPTVCPFCHSDRFKKIGFDSNGIQRYNASAEKALNPLPELYLIHVDWVSANG